MTLDLRSPYFFRTFLFVIFAELMSLFGFLYPQFQTIAFFVVATLALAVTLKRLEWGILILFAELVIGSKGYLFSFSIGGTEVSIRIALWIIVLAVWGAKYRQWSPRVWTWMRAWPVRMLILLMIAVGVGALRGWMHGNSFNTLFLDLNAWFFFALAGPVLTVYSERDAWERLFHVLLASAAVGAGKVLLLL